MAGITNAAYRRLCAEQGAGLYVCEMITSRGLVEGDETTRKMLVFDEVETGPLGPALRHRPGVRRQGVRDPVRRVRRRPRRPQLRLPGAQGDPQGRRGSAAVEARPARRDPRAAVAAAAPYDVPVTMKTRKGLDDDHLTYLDAGRIAQESGCAAIALHGRTVAQAYSGRADWDAIAELVEPRRHPGARQRRHLGGGRRAAHGRGDRRRRRGRRPRLPGPAVAVPRPGRRLRRRERRDPADPGRGARDDAPARRAAERAHGGGARLQGVPQARRRGTSRASAAGGDLRHSLALVDSLAALDELLRELDPDEPFPVARAGHSARPPGRPAQAGRAARGMARRHRRPGLHVREDARRSRADNGRGDEVVTAR